jgi:hypothetical protein
VISGNDTGIGTIQQLIVVRAMKEKNQRFYYFHTNPKELEIADWLQLLEQN